ncbi:hypothetical protein GCM10023201_02980 [Actinomycetospora corticicola]|uniref:Uncharacterized protein n=1 Tax=Actinomycetospora corticicola TaxID=663602 RepID=A0A7Y9J8W6_9PSEU|nr:hypothetical protein [Actinomycetospora corticicola]NYD39865.1 hypothetical protein [Actinomycetospora corticicola]
MDGIRHPGCVTNGLPEGAVPIGTGETEEAREFALKRLEELSTVVAALRPMLEHPMQAQPGSSLAADDRAYPEYPTSSIAWTGIAAGIDALSTFFAALAGDRTAYGTGHRALARAALNGAAAAVFVLAPPSRTIRTKHALRLAKDDLDSYETMLKDARDTIGVGSPEQWQQIETTVAERQRTLLEVSDKIGLPRGQLKKNPTLKEMLGYALDERLDECDTALRSALNLTLAQLNSAAHSGRWHMLMGATHALDTPEGFHARVVTTTTDLTNMIAGPVLLLERALNLFTSRAQPH